MVYNFKTEGRNLKDFRDYWISLKLFENLRDGGVNPKEVLKNYVKFNSDLSKIRVEVTNQKIKNVW